MKIILEPIFRTEDFQDTVSSCQSSSMLLTQQRYILHGVFHRERMFCRIAIYQEIYCFESAKVRVSRCHCQIKAISKSTNAAIYVFQYIMRQFHIIQLKYFSSQSYGIILISQTFRVPFFVFNDNYPPRRLFFICFFKKCLANSDFVRNLVA